MLQIKKGGADIREYKVDIIAHYHQFCVILKMLIANEKCFHNYTFVTFRNVLKLWSVQKYQLCIFKGGGGVE